VSYTIPIFDNFEQSIKTDTMLGYLIEMFNKNIKIEARRCFG